MLMNVKWSMVGATKCASTVRLEPLVGATPVIISTMMVIAVQVGVESSLTVFF